MCILAVTYRKEETSEMAHWFLFSVKCYQRDYLAREIYLNTCTVCLVFIWHLHSLFSGMFHIIISLHHLVSKQFFERRHCGSKYLAPFINTQLTVDRTLCGGYSGGMGEIYSFLYQVMSPVVKQCDRKSVQLWWLSSVLCPSTFSSRSLSKAHLKCTVCSLWMTHPQENELYGAGSLANKHFTICRVFLSTLLTYRLNPQAANTNSDKPILFHPVCKETA